MIGPSHDTLIIAPGKEDIYFTALENITAKIMSLDPQMINSVDKEEETSRLLSFADTVGVVEIKGALTNDDSFWNRYFGMVSYNEIREASLQALDAGVGAIVYDYSTPGGSAEGALDTADFISNIDIPTITFTSSQMASGGYLLGSQSDYIYADPFADVGSIGVIVRIVDRSKQYKDAGIAVRRFRSGKLKAVGDPAFKLTSEEEKYIEEKVKVLTDIFFATVSDSRGLSLPQMEALEITTGRTFIGEQSLKAGLVDKITSFDKTMLKAYELAAKTIDKRSNSGLIYSS